MTQALPDDYPFLAYAFIPSEEPIMVGDTIDLDVIITNPYKDEEGNVKPVTIQKIDIIILTGGETTKYLSSAKTYTDIVYNDSTIRVTTNPQNGSDILVKPPTGSSSFTISNHSITFSLNNITVNKAMGTVEIGISQYTVLEGNKVVCNTNADDQDNDAYKLVKL